MYSLYLHVRSWYSANCKPSEGHSLRHRCHTFLHHFFYTANINNLNHDWTFTSIKDENLNSVERNIILQAVDISLGCGAEVPLAVCSLTFRQRLSFDNCAVKSFPSPITKQRSKVSLIQFPTCISQNHLNQMSEPIWLNWSWERNIKVDQCFLRISCQIVRIGC